MGLSKWSLDKVQFLLSHIEDLVEDDSAELKKRIAEFEVQSGLEDIEAFGESDPSDPQVAIRVFEKLAPFYEAGLMVQRLGTDATQWWLTDFFWKGQVFRLELNDQISANRVVSQTSPLQVRKSDASKLLEELGLGFMRVPTSANAFLFRPTSQVAYILMSDLPGLWSADHVESTQRLLNKSFIF
jgi:hypothetical protein